MTWGTFWYCILGIIFVSMSAATVSTQVCISFPASFTHVCSESQAHAPYTALHTLSLLQMPVDLEVNVSQEPYLLPSLCNCASLCLQMSTFLHRVRGPTIGISCMDLFVITSSSISTVSLKLAAMSNL